MSVPTEPGFCGASLGDSEVNIYQVWTRLSDNEEWYFFHEARDGHDVESAIEELQEDIFEHYQDSQFLAPDEGFNVDVKTKDIDTGEVSYVEVSYMLSAYVTLKGGPDKRD